jgi:two-component system response regulator FixJ
LRHFATSPSCVILELHLPGRPAEAAIRHALSGSDFRNFGQSDIGMAVEVMKYSARDFLEKPFSASVMIERVREAIATYRQSMAGQIDGLNDFPGRQLLTRRERDVLCQVACGASNKEAGRRLGISPRTIEVHRARIMDKRGARNAADLMRMVLSDGPVRPAARAMV